MAGMHVSEAIAAGLIGRDFISVYEFLTGKRFRGWYIESAEGFLAPYDADPSETEELAQAMDELASAEVCR